MAFTRVTTFLGLSAVLGLAVVMLTGGNWVGAGARASDSSTLNCTFDAGTIRTFEGGSFDNQSAAKLAFGITNINMQKQTAEVVTAKGKGELKVVQAINANHFLEVVSEGFLNMTTVYEEAYGSGRMPAVHSRHFGVIGQPVVAQYTGTCLRSRT